MIGSFLPLPVLLERRRRLGYGFGIGDDHNGRTRKSELVSQLINDIDLARIAPRSEAGKRCLQPQGEDSRAFGIQSSGLEWRGLEHFLVGSIERHA